MPRRRLQSPQVPTSARKTEGGCNVWARFPNHDKKRPCTRALPSSARQKTPVFCHKGSWVRQRAGDCAGAIRCPQASSANPPRSLREGIRTMRLQTRLAALALSLLGLSGLATLAADPPATKVKPLTVLFLGDKGPHRPADRYRPARPGPRGTWHRDDVHREVVGPERRDAQQVRRAGRSTPTRRRSARTRRRRCSTTWRTAADSSPSTAPRSAS